MSPASPPPPPAAPVRSRFITGLAWVFLVVGGLLTPISALSLLMIIAGSYGTASTTLGGFLSVIVAPPAAVLAGLGLLRRRRWAWVTALALLAGVFAFNGHALLTARPTTTVTTSPSGVKTTVMASGPNYVSLPLMALALAGAMKLLSRPIRTELGAVGPRAANAPAPAVAASAEPARYAPVAPPTHVPAGARTATPSQRRAAWIAIALLGAIALGLAWAVYHGFDRGTTVLPLHRASFQRPITREAEPAFFWFAMGLYAVLALAAAALAAWFSRETLRLNVPPSRSGR